MSDDDPRPRYVQIADDLARSIDNGQLKPGQRLPSGRTLAKQYGVSLMTIQQALDRLKTEGAVAGVAGRGTFVHDGTSADTTADTTASSAEFAAIMEQLAGVREHLSRIDERLDQLERLAGPQDQ